MQGTITRMFQEAPDINGFHIKLDDTANAASDGDAADENPDGDEPDRPFSYIPGQYVMLAYDDDLDTRRAFSIVSYNPRSMEILVLIKKHGPFTQRLFDSKIGQKLEVFGPYGSFTLPRQEEKDDADDSKVHPLVFIAGGIGITPIYSMILEALNNSNNHGSDIHLFYTAKNLEQMPLYEELNEIESERFKVRHHFTAQSIQGNNSQNKRLSSNDLVEEVPDFDKGTYYICGPGAMIEGFRKELLEKGIPEERIRSEDFT
jgi:ferredoxin-NADP reductase